MAALPIDFREFSFIDIGSGKGRTLLLASEYSFRRIVGVELLAELHRAAEENVAQHRLRLDLAPSQQEAPVIEALCGDAREFVFPGTPLVVYLFNPLPEAGLRQVLHNLEESCGRNPRPVWIVYHNPVLETVLCREPTIMKELDRPEYSVFRMNAQAA